MKDKEGSVVEQEKARRMAIMRGRAAQAWCDERTERTVMDPILAEVFAEMLYDVLYSPRLRNATTGELLDELRARCGLGYERT